MQSTSARPWPITAFAVGVLLISMGSEALSAPPAASLLTGQRKFASTAKKITAEVRFQDGPTSQNLALAGARRGLLRGLELHSSSAPGSELRLTREHPPGRPGIVQINRDQFMELQGAIAQRIELRTLRDTSIPPQLRVLALAIGTTKLETALRRLGVTLQRQVLTLDRIGGRLVWAVGDGKACVWLDRELNRMARIELGPSVIDNDVWAATLTYDTDGPARGWFPTTVMIERNRVHVMTVHTTSVQMKKR